MSRQHHFDVDVAEEFGVDCAVMIYAMRGWVFHNRANNDNEHEGRTWSYNSVRAWAVEMPFWTSNQVRGILDKLIKANVLMTGNFNKVPYDRTLWYAFVDEDKWVPRGDRVVEQTKSDLLKSTNGSVQKPEPIPNIIPKEIPEEKEKKGAESTGVVPTKPVSDLFSKLYLDRCGSKPGFDVRYVKPMQALITRNGLERVQEVTRGYFETDWWFTKEKGTGRHTWSYGGFLNHFDEINSGLSRAPIDLEKMKRMEAAAHAAGMPVYSDKSKEEKFHSDLALARARAVS